MKWPTTLLVRERGRTVLKLPEPTKESSTGAWEYEDYVPLALVLSAISSAWRNGFEEGTRSHPKDRRFLRRSQDYARDQGDVLRRGESDPLVAPSKDENAAYRRRIGLLE